MTCPCGQPSKAPLCWACYFAEDDSDCESSVAVCRPLPSYITESKPTIDDNPDLASTAPDDDSNRTGGSASDSDVDEPNDGPELGGGFENPTTTPPGHSSKGEASSRMPVNETERDSRKDLRPNLKKRID